MNRIDLHEWRKTDEPLRLTTEQRDTLAEVPLGLK